jgi:hypothetical protein
MFRVVHLGSGSRIRDPEIVPIPDPNPGVNKASDPGYRGNTGYLFTLPTFPECSHLDTNPIVHGNVDPDIDYNPDLTQECPSLNAYFVIYYCTLSFTDAYGKCPARYCSAQDKLKPHH